MTINGYSESLDETTPATANTQAIGNNAELKIVLRGPGEQSLVTGLKIEAANSTVKGLVINGWDNAVFLGTGATGNKVQGNYIGTDASGTQALGNTIGGTTAAARNVISGNSTFGILISHTGALRNRVQGNYIGTNAAGTTKLGNGDDGVSIQVDADNNTIGGTTAGARNIISGNGGDGVEVRFHSGPIAPDPGPATGNRILSNSIYDNDALGIDLFFDNDPAGVTLNDPDPGDTDAGPNNLQNFPVITSAKLTTRRIGGHRRKVTIIKGTLNSTPSTATTIQTFTLQFFGSPEADPTGYGEGKTFLGQKSVTTDAITGDASFTFQTRKKVPNGQVVTATATNRSTGDTSEFSKACTVPGVPCS